MNAFKPSGGIVETERWGKRFYHISTDEVYGSLETGFVTGNYSLIQIPLIQHLKPVPIILCVRMVKLTVTVCVNQLFEQYGPFIFPENGSVVY
jgi:hypothetical protein